MNWRNPLKGDWVPGWCLAVAVWVTFFIIVAQGK